MSDFRGRVTRAGSYLSGLSFLLSVASPLQAGDEGGSPTLALNDTWKRGYALLEKGEFAKATDLLSKAADTNPLLKQAADWLTEFDQLEQQRTTLSAADCEKYVGWAKRRLEKGELRDALGRARLALENAADRKIVLDADWMARLRREAMDKAVELQSKSEWLDAYALYGLLSVIYENDQVIEDKRRDCLSHARLDAIYGKDNPKWKERLAGVDEDAVREALYYIDRRYVEPADFRKFTIKGFEQMLLLADSKSLRETFEPLADDTRRGDFVTRVERTISKLKIAAAVAKGDATKYFSRLLDINDQTLKLPKELLVSEYVIGATDALDEFTALIWPVEFKEFEKHTRGDFVGVGISIQEINKKITVVTPLEGAPAYFAGIQAGDEIVKVDGETTDGMSLTKAVQTITGPVGTTVTLSINRKGESKELEFKLKRQVVTLQSVKGVTRDSVDEQLWDYTLDAQQGIGYIRVTTFQENTVEHLRKALADLQASLQAKGSDLKGLILDLRDNPGGLLSAAVEMADLFLPEGARVVSTRDRDGHEIPIAATMDGGYDDLPLAVLVNDNSASASEIVSGALKDHKRAVLIGERTFGKFSVQNLIRLAGSEAHLKLTTAHYYLPSGRSLHHKPGATDWGVRPDIDLRLAPKEIDKIREMRRRIEVLGRKDAAAALPDEGDDDDLADLKPDSDTAVVEAKKVGEPDDQPADKPVADADAETEIEKDTNDRPEVDPQLETGRLLLRMKVLGGQLPLVAQRPKAESRIQQK